MSSKILEKEYNKIILDLMIIGNIRQGYRVCTVDGSLSVSPPSRMDCFTRWWGGEKRDLNINCIEMKLEAAHQIAKDLIAAVYVDPSESPDHKWCYQQYSTKEKPLEQLRKLSEKMRMCAADENGLAALKVTYSGDIQTCQHLELMIEQLQAKATEIENILKKLEDRE